MFTENLNELQWVLEQLSEQKTDFTETSTQIFPVRLEHSWLIFPLRTAFCHKVKTNHRMSQNFSWTLSPPMTSEVILIKFCEPTVNNMVSAALKEAFISFCFPWVLLHAFRFLLNKFVKFPSIQITQDVCVTQVMVNVIMTQYHCSFKMPALTWIRNQASKRLFSYF